MLKFTRSTRTLRTLIVCAFAALVATTLGVSVASATAAEKPYAPRIDPADFVANVDNPYFPLPPGARWVYRGKTPDGIERDVVEVTSQTKVIQGVRCIVVHDTVSRGGQVTEDTFDWYAQDREGNVWYFGEDTKEFENGKLKTTSGSWEAGVKGAQPGIIMKAHPKVGRPYRQEYAKGEAEDMARVVSTRKSVTVPAGTYRRTIETKDFTPLEPKLEERKNYARGVGVVRELTVKGGTERVELIEYTTP